MLAAFSDCWTALSRSKSMAETVACRWPGKSHFHHRRYYEGHPLAKFEFGMLDSGSHASLRDARDEINSIVSYFDIGSYVTWWRHRYIHSVMCLYSLSVSTLPWSFFITSMVWLLKRQLRVDARSCYRSDISLLEENSNQHHIIDESTDWHGIDILSSIL